MWSVLIVGGMCLIIIALVVAMARKRRSPDALRQRLIRRGYDVRTVRKESEWPIGWQYDIILRKYSICYTNVHGDLVEADCVVCGSRGVYLGRKDVIQRGADAPANPVLDPLREENFRLRQELAELRGEA